MGLIADAVCETLWPTRCALCDAPGDVLCARCAARLDYLDFWRACPHCGAAFGFLQCDHCTPLVSKGEETRLCLSALRYTADTGALIKTYKDKGEQRLSGTLAAQYGLSCIRTLNPPLARDQRILGRVERRQNVQGRFTTCDCAPGHRLLLIDDVFTTGSTMQQARIALESSGAQVRCATVARA